METPNICRNCNKTIYLTEWTYGNEWRDEIENSSICESGEIRWGYSHTPKFTD